MVYTPNAKNRRIKKQNKIGTKAISKKVNKASNKNIKKIDVFKKAKKGKKPT